MQAPFCNFRIFLFYFFGSAPCLPVGRPPGAGEDVKNAPGSPVCRGHQRVEKVFRHADAGFSNFQKSLKNPRIKREGGPLPGAFGPSTASPATLSRKPLSWFLDRLGGRSLRTGLSMYVGVPFCHGVPMVLFSLRPDIPQPPPPGSQAVCTAAPPCWLRCCRRF